MAKEMIVLQGKSFSIDLQSMLGSTCWGWCLTRLPQGIALIGMETIPTAAGVAPVIQRFWFGALSAVKDKAEIGFTLINLSDMTSAKQKVDVNVTVIPKDSEDFAKFSENCDDAVDPVCNSAMPYGVVLGNRSGNRGKCAQNCRLNYELRILMIQTNNSLSAGFCNILYLFPSDRIGIVSSHFFSLF